MSWVYKVVEVVSFLEFLLPRIHLFHDRVVEILVREERRSQHHDETDTEHHAHEGAVDQGVHAVLVAAASGLAALGFGPAG